MNRRQIQMSGGGQTIFSIIDEDTNTEIPDNGWNETQMAQAENMSKVSFFLSQLDAYHKAKFRISSINR